MPAPTTAAELVEVIRKSRLLDPARLDAFLATRPTADEQPSALCGRLRAAGLLTPFQAEQVLRGKSRGFVLGRYRVLDRIGLGGMGEVFLAEHADMRRRAALKVLPRDRGENPFARERFLREARALAALDHPNLVRAFDVGEDGDTIFLVMEYVDGISFHDLVSRHGPLATNRAAHYLLQAARGLAYLSDRGLVHRDIKPGNILVDRSGTVKILDLGLVRSETETDELTRREGVAILGTADYLAPEQAVSSSKVDGRADLYALGATAFFLLTGRPPFDDAPNAAQKLIAHQMRPAPRVNKVRAEVPEELAAVIAKLLAKKPEDRYQTPGELAEALDRWSDPVPPPTEQEIPAAAGGSVDLNPPPRASRSGGSSLSLGSASSAATPRPAVAEIPPPATPRPKKAPPTPLPAILPAAVTHNVGRTTVSKPLSPAALLPTPLAVPSPRPAPPDEAGARPLRRRVSLAVAFALTLAVAAWNVAVLAGAVPRPGSGQTPTEKTGR